MRASRLIFSSVFVLAFWSVGFASQFVVFPKSHALPSPDGRFELRSADTQGSFSELNGTFHALWLVELSTGNSRKLWDYVGVASAAWVGNDRILLNEYLNKRTSRTLIFSLATLEDPVMLDKNGLIRILPPERRPFLRENDHLFVEGSSVEQDVLQLTVWGNGHHDPEGFRWRCEYRLSEGMVTCVEESTSRSAEQK